MKTIALGAAGLGRAFSLMAPTLAGDARVRLVAGADPRPEARRRFEADFGGPAYASVEELCGDARVEAIYVATPHQHHAAHAIAAAAAGKHILVEKPMALSLDECAASTGLAANARGPTTMAPNDDRSVVAKSPGAIVVTCMPSWPSSGATLSPTPCRYAIRGLRGSAAGTATICTDA